MTPDDIRKLADEYNVDLITWGSDPKLVTFLRACADVVEAAENALTSRSETVRADMNDALSRLAEIKP